MKVAFVTCVQLGLSCMEEIYKIGGKLELLITLNDDIDREKSGRIYLDEFATTNNIPLLKIKNINDQEVLEKLKEYGIDWLFIIGWSQIAKQAVLEAPEHGCIGMHPTLLPIGRGRAAIPWAIIKGLEKTGVTMFKLDKGVDTGDIIGQKVIKMYENITATHLYQIVNEKHVELISRYWNNIVTNTISLTKQNESLATEWPGRKPEDGKIKDYMTVDDADKLVRAVTHPYPGAYYSENDNQIRIWSAKISDHKESEHAIKLVDGYLIPIEYDVE